jgi:hypothetical protein
VTERKGFPFDVRVSRACLALNAYAFEERVQRGLEDVILIAAIMSEVAAVEIPPIISRAVIIFTAQHDVCH